MLLVVLGKHTGLYRSSSSRDSDMNSSSPFHFVKLQLISANPYHHIRHSPPMSSGTGLVPDPVAGAGMDSNRLVVRSIFQCQAAGLRHEKMGSADPQE